MLYVRFQKDKGRTQEECTDITDKLVRDIYRKIDLCEELMILEDDLVYYPAVGYYGIVRDHIYDYDTGRWYYNLEIQNGNEPPAVFRNVPFTDIRAITEDYEVLK